VSDTECAAYSYCNSNLSNDCLSSNASQLSHVTASDHPSSSHQVVTNECTTSSFHSVATNQCKTTEEYAHSPTPVVDCELPKMTSVPTSETYDDAEPSIALSRNNMAIAFLPNREKVLTLFDSGASDSLVCATFVQQSNFLSKLPKIQVPSLRFKE
jgi:hypothetical protein